MQLAVVVYLLPGIRFEIYYIIPTVSTTTVVPGTLYNIKVVQVVHIYII